MNRQTGNSTEERGNGRPEEGPPTLEQFTAYQAMAEYFNQQLFGGALPPVFLNLSRKGRRTLGFFAPHRWEKGEAVTHEISLNPQFLHERPSVETAATLVHELVHLWQQVFGTPSRTSYHNREWAEKMEAVGLMPSDTGQPSGKRTGQRMRHYVLPNGPFAWAFQAMPPEYTLPWTCSETARESAPTSGRAPSKVKYTCPGCGANAWGKPDLRLVCGECERSLAAVTVTG
jgi:hypothetical protein